MKKDKILDVFTLTLFLIIGLLLFLAFGCSTEPEEPKRADYTGTYSQILNPNQYVFKQIDFEIAHYENNSVKAIGRYRWQRYGIYDDWMLHDITGHINNGKIWLDFETENLYTSWGVMKVSGSFVGTIGETLDGVLKFDEFEIADTLSLSKISYKVDASLFHNQGGLNATGY